MSGDFKRRKDGGKQWALNPRSLAEVPSSRSPSAAVCLSSGRPSIPYLVGRPRQLQGNVKAAAGVLRPAYIYPWGGSGIRGGDKRQKKGEVMWSAGAASACLRLPSVTEPPPSPPPTDLPSHTPPLPHLLSACRLIPVDAASEMMAMRFLPSMNEFFSAMLTIFWLSSAQRTWGQREERTAGKEGGWEAKGTL